MAEIDYWNLLRDVKRLAYKKVRVDMPQKLELVVLKDELDRLESILNHYFGEPLPSPNALPSRFTQETISFYGGIRPGQTLYCADEETLSEFAMLWPWEDETFVTVKIFRRPKIYSDDLDEETE